MSKLTSAERLVIEQYPLDDSLGLVRQALLDAGVVILRDSITDNTTEIQTHTETSSHANEQTPVEHTFTQTLSYRPTHVQSDKEPITVESDSEIRLPRLFTAAISKLLGILSASDASISINSRTGRESLVSDLGPLRSSIQKEGALYSTFRPLSQLVLSRASDIDIWSAVIEVVISITRSTPPLIVAETSSNSDTPITHSSASQQGSEQTRQILEQRVFEEIRFCTHRNVPGFHAKYFQNRGWSNQAKLVYEAAYKRGYNEVDKQWIGLPKSPTEDEVCNWWINLQSDFFNNERALYYRSSGGNRVGTEARRQLDLFVKSTAASPTFHDWNDILVVGELKKSDNKTKALWLQIATVVRNIFAKQPTRRFVHAFTLTGSEMETWVFDRSGPFSGTPFDIHDEPEKFVEVLCGYVMMNDDEFGLDMFIMRDDNKLSITVPSGHSTNTEQQHFELDPTPIAFQRAIVCRGTVCYLAKIAGTRELNAVVKFSWTSSLRKPEAELLHKANDRGVKGIAKIVGYQEQVTSIKELRAPLVFSKRHEFRNIYSNSPSASNSLLSQSQLPPDQTSSHSSRKRRPTGSTSLRSRSKRARAGTQSTGTNSDKDALFYDVSSPLGTSLVGQEQLPFENRILRVLAISPAGRSISQFRSVLELIGTLRDAIQVHQSLLVKGKILHRDISENNIIITDPTRADGFRGMLIDLDLAKEDGSGPSGARHRTGTMEFMAIEVLLGTAHTYRHDLESFFYVLLWLCSRRGWALVGMNHNNTNLSHWYSGRYEDIARYKTASMLKSGLESLLDAFPPAFEIVKPLCRKLRGILFPILDGDLFIGTPRDPDTLYGPILKAFDASLEDIQTTCA